MKKIRVQERDGDVWNSRTSLIRCHLSGDKELREQAMHTPEGRASAKALRQASLVCFKEQQGGHCGYSGESEKRGRGFTEAAIRSGLMESDGS